jgi:hypothetical protein
MAALSPSVLARGVEVEPFAIKERCERDFCIPHNILKIFSIVAKDSLC